MPVCSEEEFISLWAKLGSASKMARHLGIGERNIHTRRKNIERKHGINLNAKIDIPISIRHDGRVVIDVSDGVVVVFSDAHYSPDYISTAHRALLVFLKQFKSKLACVVNNGDAFDGGSLSRFPQLSYMKVNNVLSELKECQDRLGEIEAITNQPLIWCLGNHDARFEGKILAGAGNAYEGVEGMSLKDHFPRWKSAMSLYINDRVGGVVIKHRLKGGIHAPYNNTKEMGRSYVTGHLHSQKIMPHSNLNGHFWGVDTGCLADTGGKQFFYCEDGGNNLWRSGFAVLTFKDGMLLPPELVTVLDEDKGLVSFRGALVEV